MNSVSFSYLPQKDGVTIPILQTRILKIKEAKYLSKATQVESDRGKCDSTSVLLLAMKLYSSPI